MTEQKQQGAALDERLKGRRIAFALVFGLAFGFLLQKGGVAKFELLIGALLLQDWTVVKMMLSAIVVGMAGVLLLNRAGKVELKLKSTRLGANIIGGLVFGAGFALSAYCPGTGAAALGQMNGDALFTIGGMIIGSYFFAMASRSLSRTVEKWGERGKLTLPEVVQVPRGAFAIMLGLALAGALVALEKLSPAKPQGFGAPGRDHPAADIGSARPR